MYSKPVFAPADSNEVHEFIERIVFGTLVTKAEDSLVVSHLIFMLDRKRGPQGTLVSHLSKANEHAQLVLSGAESVAIFVGEHGYISSSWYPGYPIRDSAPTWNFSVVHCHGRPRALDTAGAIEHLHDAVRHLEQGRERPWDMSELGDAGIARRVENIVAFEMPIDRLDAKFKLGQDERLPDTLAAIAQMKHEGGCPLATRMEKKNQHRT